MSASREGKIGFDSTDPSSLTSPGTQLLDPGWHNEGFPDGAASPIAAKLWHGSDLVLARDDMRLWLPHTKPRVSVQTKASEHIEACTYVLLLFMDMTDLKPDIFLGQGPRRILDYIFEALGTHQQLLAYSRKTSIYLQALRVLLLLLVDYPKTEVNLIGLVKVWLHEHHLRKGFFGVLE